MARGILVCFEGLDGAGKTTIARSVTNSLLNAGFPARLVERKDPDCDNEELTKRLELLKQLIWDYGELPITELGDYHALHNMASWFSAIDYRKIRPSLERGSIVIVDNWYFKFYSRFRVKPAIDPNLLQASFAHLTRPDLVVFLDVTPEVAAVRKGDFGKGETGFFDGYGQPSYTTFIEYQQKVRSVMKELAREEGWLSIEVNDKSPEQISALVVEAIAEKTSSSKAAKKQRKR
ncbi:MAG TPA: dTMP kinase [Pyrinomonadaceae bacterium]|nr:dTMP kinase [Pyrinomonadaceae bacterium]